MSDIKHIINTLEYSHYCKYLKYVKYNEGQQLRPTKDQILEIELKSQGYLHAIGTLKELLNQREQIINQ